ncbi:hypothetical protein HYH03_014831 [Edaphochlamys debaryana]|uniref:Uncharacterized protein n=1 Tax=Edaphochlamys debaryana TaxID=47281 RepID=A0A835XTB4_9CHLO|nr:hypothetical protein HYH03_014831 [Edaphochlamys debaryana]|eukprot:KAG2486530.1 hypothetical protein HYH03_014831 [Edaphochlamys debaryana]
MQASRVRPQPKALRAATACVRPSRAVAVRVQAQAQPIRATAAALLSAVTLGLSVPAFDPTTLMLQPAHAEEEVAEEELTPYQRRMREFEKRREMLRQAREAAEAKNSFSPAAAEDQKADEEAAAERRNALGDVKGAASTYESNTRYRSFGFSAPTPEPAPEVAAPAPAPEPAPARPSFFSAPRQEAPKPEPVVEVKKAAPAPPPAPAKKAEPKKEEPASKKRRGPLPLWLAELMVMGSFAGVFVATTKYEAETKKVLALAGTKAKELYFQAEKALAAQK